MQELQRIVHLRQIIISQVGSTLTKLNLQSQCY
jgi:hypothetical protein